MCPAFLNILSRKPKRLFIFIRLSGSSNTSLNEVLDEVANLTTQNRVAILKTYGVETPLERSAELGALGERPVSWSQR